MDIFLNSVKESPRFFTKPFCQKSYGRKPQPEVERMTLAEQRSRSRIDEIPLCPCHTPWRSGTNRLSREIDVYAVDRPFEPFLLLWCTAGFCSFESIAWSDRYWMVISLNWSLFAIIEKTFSIIEAKNLDEIEKYKIIFLTIFRWVSRVFSKKIFRIKTRLVKKLLVICIL